MFRGLYTHSAAAQLSRGYDEQRSARRLLLRHSYRLVTPSADHSTICLPPRELRGYEGLVFMHTTATKNVKRTQRSNENFHDTKDTYKRA